MTEKILDDGEVEPAEIKVVVMEDHGPLCEVLVRAIQAAPGMNCCGHFRSGKATLDAMEELRPDVVSIDLSMPDINGLLVLQHINNKWPEMRCIVFSCYADEEYVRRAFIHGALGYVSKDDVGSFIGSIRKVANGERFLSSRFRYILGVD